MVILASSALGSKPNPIKILTRDHGATMVSVCNAVYLAGNWPSIHVGYERRRARIHAPRRLVVFGDSWSDNGKYPIDSPRKRLLPVKEEAQSVV